MYLIDYECMSSAGDSVEAFISGLYSSKIHSRKVTETQFNRSVSAGGLVCFFPETSSGKIFTYQQSFSVHFNHVIQQMKSRTTAEQKDLMKKKKVLCLLSSTKGCIEDSIWQEQGFATDPFTSLYEDIRQQFGDPQLQIMTVSNACSSSHVAIEMAKYFIDSEIYDYVYVIAFDFIGPFVYSGFQALKVLSQSQNRPFASDRDGLQLGEAMAVLLFSAVKMPTAKVQITGVASLIEPSSVTRPRTDGKSLLAVMEKANSQSTSEASLNSKPDFFLAHGTGTVFNDLTEEKAYSEFQGHYKMSAPITSTKWSIGHCLGASGAMDLIAASEIIHRQKLFNIASTSTIDSGFQNYFLSSDQVPEFQPLKSALVTSLGFGGVYAAIRIQKISEEKAL